MNPYAKIGIKIGIVVLICIILLIGYNMVGHKAIMAQVGVVKGDLALQQAIKTQVDSLLAFEGDLPNIRYVQLKDMETIRTFMPPAEEFVLTGYLRSIHGLLADDHLDTNGIIIGGGGAAAGGTSFEQNFASDITAIAASLQNIMAGLQMFRDKKSEMNNLLVSLGFYQTLSSGTENLAAILGGIERHTFTLSVTGNYENIKKFTFDVYNMRPHTALSAFQMLPVGGGMGPTRVYQANFVLVTYADSNGPPPLWEAYHQRGEEAEAVEGGAAEGQDQVAETGAPASITGEPTPGETGAGMTEEPPRGPNENSTNAGAAVAGKPESEGTNR